MRAVRMMIVTAMVVVAVPAAAQGGQRGQGANPEARAAMQQRQNEMLFRGITLSEAQQAKVDSIQAAGREAMQAAMGGGMQDPTARQRMQELREKQMADIRAVLTPEQQAVFDTNRANMPAPGAGRRPPRER